MHRFSEPLSGLELVLSGHIHEFSTLNFISPQKDPSRQRPPQWIVGNGGDKLEVDPPFYRKPFNRTVDSVEATIFMMEGFGFLVLNRNGREWMGTLFDARDRELVKCSLKRRNLLCPVEGAVANEDR